MKSGQVANRVRHLNCCTSEERFWAKVDKSGGPDACWPFMGARVPAGGYGRAILNGRLIAAHRVAYLLTHGELPADLDIMHLCDTPPCCNPAHLKAATTLENMRDCLHKGRFTTASLKPEQVREIRKLLGTKKQTQIARELGVGKSVVHGIATRGSYRHIK